MQTFGGLGTLEVIVVRSEGRGRCLDRNEIAESERISGKIFSSGRYGLSRNCTSKSGPCCFLAKRRASGRKKLAQLRERSPGDLATHGLHILAVTMTDAPLKPWNGEKIVLCSEQILVVIELFP